MILLVGILAGILVGLGWASRCQVKYEAPALHHLWLVVLAFLPQIGDPSPTQLIISQILFIAFAFLNRQHFGMKILMAGAILNFLVMATNGGLMPIRPEIANQLISQNVLLDHSLGDRFGAKDILLLAEQTRFEWLADRFLLPAWFPYRVAFSLGDVFIAVGAFWLLAIQQINQKEVTYDRSNYLSTAVNKN
jgi:hypothetical protein